MSAPLFDAEPRLDHSVIDQVVQLESVRPGLVTHLIGVFERNFSQLMVSLEDKLDRSEHDALRIAFHSLKGAAASLGAQRLSKMAGFAECLAASEMPDPAFYEIRAVMQSEFVGLQVALAEKSAASGNPA